MYLSKLKHQLLFFLLCFVSNLKANDSYVFHKTKLANEYFLSVKSGTASYNLSNSNHLNIQYSFNNQALNSFSLLYNYKTKIQDLSYNPISFTLKYKGGNVLTKVNLQFWEDINSNGFFDSDDEVYISETLDLGATDFSNLTFDIQKFTKVTGDGNNKFDLNRIRAFEFILSNNNSIHQGEIEWENLALNFSPQNLAITNSYNINGSFIQLWNDVGCKCGSWTKERWEEELDKMEQLCIDELIIQYSAYENVAWYNQSKQNFIEWKFNALNHIFDAAQGKNIKIVLGTFFSESWNHDDKSLHQTYDKITNKNQLIINEIATNFGNHPNFGGWYIPQEINDLEWQVNPQKNLLFNWLNQTANIIRNVSDKKITIAPFFNLWQPADVILNWYKDLHTNAPNINEIALQVGVGIGLKKINYHIPLYYNPLKEFFNTTNTQIGITIENFEQTSGWPLDNGNFTAKTASIDRFKNQIEWAKNLNLNPIYTFEWGYLQPQNNNIISDKLFQDFEQLTNCSPTSNLVIKNQGYKIVQEQLIFDENQDIIAIYNLNGQLIRLLNNTSFVDYNDLKPGVYVVKTNQIQKIKLLK
jgi:hypothetical protein